MDQSQQQQHSSMKKILIIFSFLLADKDLLHHTKIKQLNFSVVKVVSPDNKKSQQVQNRSKCW